MTKSSYKELLESVLSRKALVLVSDTLDFDVYTYHVPQNDDSKFVNAVFTVGQDELLSAQLIEYNMSSKYQNEFYEHQANFVSFEGGMKILPIANLKFVVDGNENSSNESSCFEFILSESPSTPTNGGGGGGGVISDVGSTPNTGDGPVGGPTFTGGNGPGCYEIIYLPCTCVGHTDPNACSCSDGGPTQVIRIYECSPDENFHTVDTDNKNFDPKECISLLSLIGVVPRALSNFPGDAHIQEHFELAVSETCFDVTAVAHIIDVPAFELCLASGGKEGKPRSGPDCIKDQVLNYLNNLLPDEEDPNSPLVFPYDFTGLSHEQQAVFFHAAVAGEGNEHVLRAIATSRRNLDNEIVNNNLPLFLLYISSLSQASDIRDDYQDAVNNFINIYPELSDIISENKMFDLTRSIGTLNLLYLLKDEGRDDIGDLILEGITINNGILNDNVADWIAKELFLENFMIDSPSRLNEDTGENEVVINPLNILVGPLLADCFKESSNDASYIIENSELFSNFKITLFADQTNPGTRDPYSGVMGLGGPIWGHSFISLSATDSSGMPVRLTFGFYPGITLGKHNALNTVESKIYDNSKHAYNVSLEVNLTLNQFNTAMTAAVELSSTDYNTEGFNCTNYAIDVANSTGAIVVPKTQPNWYSWGRKIGKGANPGDFGEDIRLVSPGLLTSFNQPVPAPSSTCN